MAMLEEEMTCIILEGQLARYVHENGMNHALTPSTIDWRRHSTTDWVCWWSCTVGIWHLYPSQQF